MLHTRFCDLLGIEYPIVSAPMGDRWAGADLAAAVSAAGGLGLIGGQASKG
jgi:NAD(P)H-dependent flavin oxidoreductase YrpB (nitropropane dioxygenase family)